MKPLAASTAGAAAMKKPAAKNTTTKEDVKRTRRIGDGGVAVESLAVLLEVEADDWAEEVDSAEAADDWNLRCFKYVLGIEIPV